MVPPRSALQGRVTLDAFPLTRTVAVSVPPAVSWGGTGHRISGIRALGQRALPRPAGQ